MGNRFTRTAPIKNEIDIEKQEQQTQNNTVEEATEEMKVMIYSPGHSIKEEKVDGFEAQNGIEKGQNGIMNGTKTTKAMKKEPMENGHNSAVGETSSLEMNSNKKLGQNGHNFGQLTVNNKVENASGKMAHPRKCGGASGQKRQTKTEIAAVGRRRGRPSRKFTGNQIKMLEKKFQTTQYMALPDRVELAEELGMLQSQVKLLISTSSHKLGLTNDAAEKQGTVSDLFESKAAKIEILHEEKLEYLDSLNETNIVLIQMTQSNNKRKWIFLITRLSFAEHKFAKIFIPDDAYSMINKMDELMSKIVDLEKPPDTPIFVRVSGIRYDYLLGIRQNLNLNGNLQFKMDSITTATDPWHNPKQMYMPIQLFPLLRDIMAKMLKEFDGTKQIGQLPSPLPKLILQSEEDSNQQNVVKTSEEAGQLETIRQGKLDFTVNTFSGNFDRQIIIELQRNKQGEEFIQIVQKFDKLESSKDIGEENKKIVFFPPIPIIDAYRLPDSMQALSNDLEEKYPGLRIPNDIPSKVPICRQIIKGGLLYDYKLAICICPFSYQLDFTLKTITTGANKLHKSEKLYGPIPLDVFNWLKEQIAVLLKSSSNQQKQKTFQKEPLEFKNVNGRGQKIAYKDIKIREGLIRRETEYYNVEGELHDRMMNIEFKQGKSGRKYILIVQRFIEKDRALFINFPKIPLPEDIYRLLDAMRDMSNELEEKRPTLFIGENKPSTICQKLVKGFFYNYKMELNSLQNQQLDFRLQTMPNKADDILFEPKSLQGPIPIDIFNWMMEQIAEILEDYYESDGNEK